MFDKVSIPEAMNGEWRVERFKVAREDWSSLLKGRGVPVGEEFTRLMRGHTLVMSDTPAEMRDHYAAVRQARGERRLLNKRPWARDGTKGHSQKA